MRLVLAILIGLTQVAGPLLCCCVQARLFAIPSPCCTAGHRQTADAPEPKCCCRAKADPGPDAGCGPAHPADTPAGDPDQCPCGCRAGEVILPAVLDPTPTSRAGDLHPAPVFGPLADHPAAITTASATDLSGVTDLPFLSTETRLFAHHVLRC